MFKCSVQEGWQGNSSLARRCPGDKTRRIRTSSQASFPRVVTSPQLPSPRTLFIVVYILV